MCQSAASCACRTCIAAAQVRRWPCLMASSMPSAASTATTGSLMSVSLSSVGCRVWVLRFSTLVGQLAAVVADTGQRSLLTKGKGLCSQRAKVFALKGHRSLLSKGIGLCCLPRAQSLLPASRGACPCAACCCGCVLQRCAVAVCCSSVLSRSRMMHPGPRTSGATRATWPFWRMPRVQFYPSATAVRT
jgi:hypothetical protein